MLQYCNIVVTNANYIVLFLSHYITTRLHNFVTIMKHRGEIVSNAIRKSGLSLTAIAKALGTSRTSLYRWLEDPHLSLDTVFKIGKVIKHDFSEEIKELTNLKVEEPQESYKSGTREKVSITIELDGTEETINKWLRLLPELNKVMQLKAG